MMRRQVQLLVNAVLAATLAQSLGCVRAPQVYVPIQDTAQEQYRYAVSYRESHLLELRDTASDERSSETRMTLKKTFERVVDYFPEDRLVTPLARLEIAEMNAGHDRAGYRAKSSELERAVDAFREIRDDYPEFDYVRAKSLYGEALSRRSMDEFTQSNDLFKQLIDEFIANKDPYIQALVARSRYYSQQITVQ